MYTVEDIYALLESMRAVLVDRKIWYMESPGTIHQEIAGQLLCAIANHIKQNDFPCKVYGPRLGVLLKTNTEIFVEPDISVISDPAKLDDRGCNGAPEWIIEIMIPSSRKMDYIKKLYHYEAAGVREYWIVDPEEDRITVWNFSNSTFRQYTFADTVSPLTMPGLSINFLRLSAVNGQQGAAL